MECQEAQSKTGTLRAVLKSPALGLTALKGLNFTLVTGLEDEIRFEWLVFWFTGGPIIYRYGLATFPH